MRKQITTYRNHFMAITLMLPILIFSCNHNEKPRGVQLYKGAWNGTYSGADDNGAWRVQIDDKGTISGTATSITMTGGFELTGTVNSEGDFQATSGSTTFGTTFNGKLNGTNGQGTWQNIQAGISGNWSGSKEEDPSQGIGIEFEE
ncbi:hypothetical protein [Pleomorphovibrio marinus]|uniref:hypothetical protein n=1 Tax=Pleomorphovibrio marinus TaxID=2164132 RepID=UPI0013003848|nr:hypothetical protein [Pleomorphovibrio marinus]